MNRRAHKLITTYLTVLALVFNALWSAYAVATSNEQGVLLCTSQGYKWVKVSLSEAEPQQKGEHCKLCLFPPSDETPVALASSCGELRSPRYLSYAGLASQPTLYVGRIPYLLALGRAPPLS